MSGTATGSCGCCQGVTGLTPVTLANRPGLTALAYRVGTQAQFKESLLAEISAQPALQALTTREDDDPTIALLDAWAVALDVLTFYQERIANEGFLRTATERRSLLELARTIGYELAPGVAASTWLAFTLDPGPGAPPEVLIPAGTRAQSVPIKTELPQSFETGAPLLARPDWNALKPQLLKAQTIGTGSTEASLAGVATQLRPGDALLLGTEGSWEWRILTTVQPQTAEGVTRVAWKVGLTIAASSPNKVFALRQRAALFGANAPDWKAMTEAFKTEYTKPIVPPLSDWPDLKKLAAVKEIDLDTTYPRIAPDSWVVLVATVENAADKINVRRVDKVGAVSRSGFSLSARVTRLTLTATIDAETFDPRNTAVFAESEELALAQQPCTDPVADKDRKIELDRLVGGLAAGQALVVQGRRRRVRVEGSALPLAAEDGSRSVTLEVGATAVVLAPPVESPTVTTWRLRDRDGFEGIATLTKELVFEAAPPIPIVFDAAPPAPVAALARSAVLDAFLDPTPPPPSLTVLPAAADDPLVAELAVLTAVTAPDPTRTHLQLAAPLGNLFDRSTVTVFANVAAATHGETRSEVLGSGDSGRRFQRFTLRQKLLTYTPAPVPSGGLSSLAVAVGGVLWHEAPDFFGLGPRDRKYVLRRDDAGNTTVRFGDGVHGARLPSDVENVAAVYRTGIGLSGLVAENRISLLVTKPLGVKSVINPIAATGAADPETRDQARHNAPLTVLTLDRVVSLRDFEDFAHGFSGIGKAQSRELWERGRRLVHLTVAGVGGSSVDPGSALYTNLRAALDRLRDPFQALRVDSYDRLLFRLHLRVKTDPDRDAKAVLQAVEAALREAFSFAARDFGQSVFLSEVMALTQRVPGVVYVDVDRLYQEGLAVTLEHRLETQPARLADSGAVLRAQILLLHPEPVDLGAIP
ncbi:MAG TPA: putative baseplate assembly protein [Thermoanaerobaculia bacterium]|nr:putative baseplate assembly protein [Thermoanaerobaculia bacterium]